MFLGVDWGKLLTFDFWLAIRPGGLSNRFEIIFLVFLILLYALYIYSLYMQKHEMKDKHYLFINFWNKFSSFSLTMAITFTFIFFFRYEGIPYFGGRFWMVAWFILGAIWFYKLLKYYYKTLPSLLAEQSARAQKMKYM